MINENALRDALLALAQDGKSHYLMFSEMLTEVAALRDSVRGLDPTFQDVLDQRRRERSAENVAIVNAVIRGYDEIIQRLKAGEVC